METERFECACHSDSHTLKFQYDPEEREIYVHARMDREGTWSRVRAGLRSVLRLKPKPQWECFILQPQDATRLMALLERLIQDAAPVPTAPQPRKGGRSHAR